MKLKKSMLVAGAVTTLGVAGLAGLNTASAQSSGGESLVEKIASRFNLNQDEVQAVFDESKAEHHAEMEAEFSERLQEKVDDGDLTVEQKTLIENKAKELHESLKAELDELKAWADQNSIKLRYLMGGPRHDNRLDDAVEDGDITTEQRTLIEQKRDELEAKRETARNALEQWAEDNNIDANLLPGRMDGHGRGHGKRWRL